MLIKGNTALMMGAMSGIGFYTAGGHACEGATVYVTGRSEDSGREAESRGIPKQPDGRTDREKLEQAVRGGFALVRLYLDQESPTKEENNVRES